MKQINIIISTKYYPYESKIWFPCNDIVFPNGYKLYYKPGKNSYKYSIKKRDFNLDEETICSVFVVPCTEDDELSNKLQYLEEILKLVLQNKDESSINAYLIAHDKDFCIKNDDCLITSIGDGVNISNFKFLEKLLNKRRIYLFQHQTGKIAVQLKKIPKTEDGFTEQDCNDLYRIIDKSRMIQHFNDINTKSTNLYTKK